MKQFILIGLFAGLLSATIPIRAQVTPRDSDARKGSRLELGRSATTSKTTTPVVGPRRFSLSAAPTLSNPDRPGTLRQNTPINEHYRSVLITRTTAKSTTKPVAVESAQTASTDVRLAQGQEGKAEDRMFANDRLWVSNAYPNPAHDVAEVDYQFSGNSPAGDARLVMLNVLGAPVAEYTLDPGDHKVRLVTTNLATGYYLYQLSLDGKKVATKRLLVRHQ